MMPYLAATQERVSGYYGAAFKGKTNAFSQIRVCLWRKAHQTLNNRLVCAPAVREAIDPAFFFLTVSGGTLGCRHAAASGVGGRGKRGKSPRIFVTMAQP